MNAASRTTAQATPGGTDGETGHPLSLRVSQDRAALAELLRLCPMHRSADSPALDLEVLGSVATQQHAGLGLVEATPGQGNNRQMSLEPTHIQHHASSVILTKKEFETVSGWIDERIQAHGDLRAEERNDPGSVNLLHNILIDDQPTAVDHEAALDFTDMVERFTSNSPVDLVATAALEIAKGIRYLANKREVLHLTLV